MVSSCAISNALLIVGRFRTIASSMTFSAAGHRLVYPSTDNCTREVVAVKAFMLVQDHIAGIGKV